MAGERQLPGLGLTGFWDEGSAFKAGMDTNLLLLSVIAGGVVASRQAAAPGTPADGDIVIATSDWGATVTAQSIQVRDNGAWVEIIPQEGLTLYDQGSDETLIYNGATWAALATGGGGGGGLTLGTEITGAYDVTNGDLAGGVYKDANSGSALTITVPPGLTGTEPFTVEQTGAGVVSFAAGAGVTINSRGAALDSAGQYAVMVLVPKGSDVYTLSGDLA